MKETVDVAKIAQGLSEPMRDALCFYPSMYADQNTIRALHKRGLTAGSLLTALGVAVREYLVETQAREAGR